MISIIQTDIYEVCPTPLVLAQQLTHLELERLSMIGAEEFVQAFVKDNDKDKVKYHGSKMMDYKDVILVLCT